MSAASGRELEAPQAVTKPKRLESNRLAKLRLHLANIYRLVVKELRSIRSDPIMLALVAYTFTLRSMPLPRAPRRKRPNSPSASSTKTVRTCRGVLRTASHHPPSSRPWRLQQRKSTQA